MFRGDVIMSAKDDIGLVISFNKAHSLQARKLCIIWSNETTFDSAPVTAIADFIKA